MLQFPIQNMDIILLVAGLIIVIKGINLGFKILHRLVDKRLPGSAAHSAEVRG